MNGLRLLRGLASGVLVALLVAGCSAFAQSGTASAASPPLHHAPDGGYVPGNTSYHGTGGP